MSKKAIKVLGVKAAEKMMTGGSYSKIQDAILEEKFSPEAIRYLLDNYSSPRRIIDDIKMTAIAGSNSYSFNNIYKDFEDYINSGFSTYIYEEGECGEYIDWLGDIPNSSEELISIYNSSDEEIRNAIYKTLMYRKRAMILNENLIEKYNNCFDAIVEITQRENPSIETTVDLYSYVSKWCCSINRNTIEKIISVVGLEKTISMMRARKDLRYDYCITITSMLDMMEVLGFLLEKDTKITPDLSVVARQLDFNSCWSIEDLKNDHMFEIARQLYDKFFGCKVGVNGIKSIDVDLINLIGTNAGTFLAYERVERKKDALFDAGIKILGYDRFVYNLCCSAKRKEITLSSYCCNLSRILARDFNELILNKKITTADELLILKRGCFPHRVNIGRFSTNPFVYNYINLEEFSDEDIEKISNQLSWTELRGYFKEEVVPLSFMIKYFDRLREESIVNSVLRGRFTMPETIYLLDSIGSRMSEGAVARIISNAIEIYKEGATEVLMAKLVKYIPTSSSISFNYLSPKYNNLSLRNILTLL